MSSPERTNGVGLEQPGREHAEGSGRVKVVAFYYPQFHAIAENSAWWGEGFTDWTNVRKALPQFRGHYQPRIPAGRRYYDQAELSTIEWQIDTAKTYGLSGFCHYHYWFDGKQLLERPTNIMLAARTLNFPFCLAWANETWSRRWDGRDHHILQEQTHRPDKALWQRHFDYLIRCWSDERALRIDGRPVFLVYRAHRIDEIGNMFDLWREAAHQHGLPGLYLVCMKQYEFPIPEVLQYFDATMQFQPFEAIYSPDFVAPPLEAGRMAAAFRRLPDNVQNFVRTLRYRYADRLTFYDYDMVWKHILLEEREGGIPAFPGAFVDWDNTPRYGKRARIFRGASPERFAFWFRQLVHVTSLRPAVEQMIFLNAWNEWAEGAYLEPDQRYGYGYLDAIRECLSNAKSRTEEVHSAAPGIG